MQADLETIILTEEQIDAKVRELGAQISADYLNKNLLLINVLRGGVIFLADLVREISIPVTLDFMAITSYGGATQRLGVVRMIKDLEENINDRHVLVVEDIVDTGLTLNYLINNLRAREPASLEICTLLDKSARRIVDLPVAYKGFDIPDTFVVGYGLDYQQKYRNLPYIGALKDEIFEE